MPPPPRPPWPPMSDEPHAQMLGALFVPSDFVDVRGVEIVPGKDGKKEVRRERYRPKMRARELSELTLSPDFDHLHMFVGINPRSRPSGREDAVSRRCNIGVDIDIEGLTPEDVLAMIEAAGYPPPTVLVFSGRGYHVWWSLTRSVSKQQWEGIQRTATQDLDGDTQVCNPAHCLRLAGTFNPKRGEMTELVVCDRSRRYSPESFPGFVAELTPPSRGVPPAPSARSASLLSPPPTVTADPAGGTLKEGAGDKPTDEQLETLITILSARPITEFGTSDSIIHKLARLIKRTLALGDRPPWLETAMIAYFNEHSQHMR